MSSPEELIRRFQQQLKRKPKDDQERMQERQSASTQKYIQELDEQFSAIAKQEEE